MMMMMMMMNTKSSTLIARDGAREREKDFVIIVTVVTRWDLEQVCTFFYL